MRFVGRREGEANEMLGDGMKRRMRQFDAHKAMCQINTEENKRWYISMKHKSKKGTSRSLREKAEEVLTGYKKLLKWDVSCY